MSSRAALVHCVVAARGVGQAATSAIVLTRKAKSEKRILEVISGFLSHSALFNAIVFRESRGEKRGI